MSVSFFSFFDRILLTISRFKVWLGLHFKEALATYLVCNLLFNNALQKVPVSRAQTTPTPSHTYARCVYLLLVLSTNTYAFIYNNIVINLDTYVKIQT